MFTSLCWGLVSAGMQGDVPLAREQRDPLARYHLQCSRQNSSVQSEADQP